MAKYECRICGYIHDEEVLAKSFEEVYSCPICDGDKRVFRMISEPQSEEETDSPADEKEGLKESDLAEESVWNPTEDNPVINEELNEKDEFVIEPSDAGFDVEKTEEMPADLGNFQSQNMDEEEDFFAGYSQKNDDFVVERRQEFWATSDSRDDENTEFTIVKDSEDNLKDLEVEKSSLIQTFYSNAEPVKTQEQLMREEEEREKEEQRKFSNIGGGGVHIVITPQTSMNEAKEESFEEETADATEEENEEILVESDEAKEEPKEKIWEPVRFDETTENADALKNENGNSEAEAVTTEDAVSFNEFKQNDEFPPKADNVPDFFESTVDDFHNFGKVEETFFDDSDEFIDIPIEETTEEILFEEDENEELQDESQYISLSEDTESIPEEGMEEDEINEETESIPENVNEEPMVNEEPAVDDEPMADEEPLVDEEPVVDEEPMVNEETIVDEESVIEEKENDIPEGFFDENEVELPEEEFEELQEEVITLAENEEPEPEVNDSVEETESDELPESEETENAEDTEETEETEEADETEEVEETEEVVVYSMLKGRVKYNVLCNEEDRKIFEDFSIGEERISNGLENIILLPAQFNPVPLGKNVWVDCKTTIGHYANSPVEVLQPFCFSKLFLWGEYIPGKENEEDLSNRALILMKGEGGHIPNVSSIEEFRREVEVARKKSNGTPIGADLIAGRIEKDLEACVYAGLDFVIINDITSRILPYALRRAKNYLNRMNSKIEILVCVDALKDAQELAKILAMGADFVLVERGFDLDMAEKITEDLKEIARSTGHRNVHDINITDICTIDSDLAAYTDIEHV